MCKEFVYFRLSKNKFTSSYKYNNSKNKINAVLITLASGNNIELHFENKNLAFKWTNLLEIWIFKHNTE